MMNNEEFNKLLDKYAESRCSEEEKIVVENWYSRFNENESRQLLSEQALTDVQDRLRQRLIRPVKQPNVIIKYRYFAVASVLLFILTIGAIFYMRQKPAQQQMVAQSPILPGSNKAILILANGRQIDLSAAPKGRITDVTNSVVKKQSGGEVQFSGSGDTTAVNNNLLNAIAIPRGGQWKLTLQDGTAIWLNAATTLRFPTAFTGHTREIFLDGEAYFEVAKDKEHPFIVHTGKQTVEVLGTHFNINSYPEEGNIQTTLLEGSVKLNGSTLLKPGQQSSYNGTSISVREADTEEAIAWKEGNFIFNSADLASIMRQVSRWYNVEVAFQAQSLKGMTFSGIVSRSVSISTLLRRLSLTKEVDFKTQGRKILILPNKTNN